MKLSFSNVLAAASILVWATAWAATEKKADAEMPAATGTAPAASKLYTEVSYDKGSNALREQDRAKIDNLVNSASRMGKISEVRVLSWADAAYPTGKGAKLSDAQRELAEQRNKTIETELSGRDLSVKAYNMAEKPSALADLMKTSDAKVKQSFAQAGLSGKSGKISKSMVLVIMSNE